MVKLFFSLLIVISAYSSAMAQAGKYSNLKKNIISVNYLNLVNGNLHLQYERILNNPVFGVKASVNIGVADFDLDVLAYRRKFTTGADFNIYPTGQGKVRYFIGPAFRVGALQEDFQNSFASLTIDYSYYSFLLSNGFHIHVKESFYMNFQAALGIGFFNARNKDQLQALQLDDNFAEPDGILAFNAGWRF